MTQNIALEKERTAAFGALDLEPADEDLIPAHLAHRSGLNIKFLAAGGALILVIAGLMVYGLLTASAYYLTVSEVQSYYAESVSALQTGDESMLTRRIRVNGEVVAGSEEWIAEDLTLRFAIHDETGATLPIVFYGPRPDNFQRAASAIIEGELLADGSFQADTLLLKCPSRYEEEPEEIFVQSTR